MSEAKDKGKQVSKVPRGPYAKENRPHGTKSDHRKTTDVPRDRNYFLKYPQSVWYEQAKELPSLDSNEMLEDENRILKLKEEAKQLYETLSEEFDGNRSKRERTDEAWMTTVMKSGTMVDKMAAMILLVQSAPLYRVKTLHALLNQAAKHGRRESLMAIDTLKDLFMTNLLPGDRKLVPFHLRPLKASNVTEMHKVYWYYEDILKSIYAEFVSVLHKSSHDSVVHTKRKVQHTAFELLMDKPEQEQQLLSLIVNKLGDPERKVASNSAHLLNALLKKHKGMKLVVAREVETFLHRSSITPRAQYYGVIFLNQIMLNEDQIDLSKKLLAIYLSMFKKLIEVSKDIDSKMLSALLTGVNRAFPFAPIDQESFSEQLDVLFELVQRASFNKSAQALQLIYQIMYAQQNITDRFYSALYRKLASPELSSSSRQGIFLNVLYKALKNDTQLPRVSAFVKRILQVCLFQSPGFICGCLFLISEIMKGKQELKSQFEKSVSISDEMKSTSAKIVAKITAQMDQGSSLASVAASIPGAELGSGKQAGKIVFGGKERLSAKKTATPSTAPSSSAMDVTDNGHEESSNIADGSEFQLSEVRLERYDPTVRNPLYAHAETTCWWELVNLSKHFHPSVSKWAHAILANESIEYSGDPLVDFGLHAFLDRIIYKNPKQLENSKNSHSKKSSIPSERTIPANAPSFIERAEEQVPEDQLFFYKYFQQRASLKPKDKKKEKEADSDMDEFSDVDSFGSADFDGDGGASGSDFGSDVEDGSDAGSDAGGSIGEESVDFSDSMDEHEVEEAVLKGFEKKEGRKLFDRKAMEEDEGKTYSYDDLKDADFEDEEDDHEHDGDAMDSFLSTLGPGDSSDEDGDSMRDNTDFMSDKPAKKKTSAAPQGKTTKQNKKSKSSFADIDEFQHILETSGMNEDNKWDNFKGDDRPRKNFKKRKQPSGGHKGAGRGKQPQKRSKR